MSFSEEELSLKPKKREMWNVTDHPKMPQKLKIDDERDAIFFIHYFYSDFNARRSKINFRFQ